MNFLKTTVLLILIASFSIASSLQIETFNYSPKFLIKNDYQSILDANFSIYNNSETNQEASYKMVLIKNPNSKTIEPCLIQFSKAISKIGEAQACYNATICDIYLTNGLQKYIEAKDCFINNETDCLLLFAEASSLIGNAKTCYQTNSNHSPISECDLKFDEGIEEFANSINCFKDSTTQEQNLIFWQGTKTIPAKQSLLLTPTTSQTITGASFTELATGNYKIILYLENSSGEVIDVFEQFITVIEKKETSIPELPAPFVLLIFCTILGLFYFKNIKQ